ncbi:carbohydrate binding family 9 domain-containing protein, partial [bacterium]|nr:carbohydrate binding family 9 domain-containing protein [bacterium]
MRKPTLLMVCGVILLLAQISYAEKRSYTTTRTDEAPRIDGNIDESVWNKVNWTGDFLQRDPVEGVSPTGQTAFKILYDDENLYLAYHAKDPEPDKLASIMSRRDHFPGDWVEVNIDSYHDGRTAFSFTASLSGTQGDELISEDGNNWNPNWDPIWDHAALPCQDGWTAEVRIPLSQLRYGGDEEQVWGIQVQRRIHRIEERS